VKIYDDIFNHAILSSIILLDQQIDFYKINTECYYKDIAYVISSSGTIFYILFYNNNFFWIGSTGIPKLIFVSHACIIPNLDQLK